MGWAVSRLITNPGERAEGQSQFYTVGATNQGLTYNVDTADEAPAAADPGAGEEVEDPEKADIYKLTGDRLYYANASAARMQMVDLSNPSAPVLAAEKVLEHTPNEIYVVEPYVFLMQTKASASETGLILTVMDSGASLAQAGQLSLDGLSYITSRRLGNTIFLVARPGQATYYAEETAANGPVVVAVDISTPANPTEISRYQAQGYASEVYLDQSRLVLLARQGWQSTRLVIFDLAAGDTPLSVSGNLDVAGYVPSEFHVKAKDDYLYVIFRQQDIDSGSALAVYDISNLSAISKTGEVTRIAEGEELYAARFSGDRAYLVTYERVDPLWVVDVSDPTAPTVLGSWRSPDGRSTWSFSTTSFWPWDMTIQGMGGWCPRPFFPWPIRPRPACWTGSPPFP